MRPNQPNQSANLTAVVPLDLFDCDATETRDALMTEAMYLKGATIMRGMRWWVSMALDVDVVFVVELVRVKCLVGLGIGRQLT